MFRSASICVYRRFQGLPAIGSRIAAVALLPVLAVGGLVLADALAGNLIRGQGPGAEVQSEDTNAISDARPPAPKPRAAAPQPCAPCDRTAAEDRAVALEVTGLKGDAREWAESVFGGVEGQQEDAVPPPAGSCRLFRMAGGYTFYRLAEGDPAERARQAVTHYRRLLTRDGWKTLADRTSSGAPAGTGLAGQGHLIVGSRGGRTVDIFVHQRDGAARVIVRTASSPARVSGTLRQGS